MAVAKHHYEVEELMMVAVCEALLQLAAQRALLEGGCGGMHGQHDRNGQKTRFKVQPERMLPTVMVIIIAIIIVIKGTIIYTS